MTLANEKLQVNIFFELPQEKKFCCDLIRLHIMHNDTIPISGYKPTLS